MLIWRHEEHGKRNYYIYNPKIPPLENVFDPSLVSGVVATDWREIIYQMMRDYRHYYYINDDDGYNESNLVSTEIDESEFIMNDMIEKIKEKLSPYQTEIFYYLINDYKPREVSKILGISGVNARKNYGYIRDKARKTLEYYNLDI